MHGREGGEERRKQYGNPHMRTVPTRVGVARDADGSVSSPASSSPSFFCKDGRKIRVGDCALFKSSQDSPPFIGLICSLTASKESGFTLGVNWLYRPTEVKLGKGIQLEAVPNEVFYSLRRNAISPTSLLHPCKVAFLPKGVELPPGISSFVCRRVYDTKSNRLWWLTDKNYLSEHQEEISQLLYKTRIEMHASAQPNGRSPKQINVPLSPGQLKGKKRERGDHSSDSVKRERSAKPEDDDSDHLKSECLFKSEIAKVAEKGPLIDSDGVDRLVQVMFYEKNERKQDLSARSMLVNVVAGTDKLDCLRRFVQLRGLSVLDDWLQEIHKGKIGDGSGLTDNDKAVEEFLCLLLRALEKLPVNLQALQLCNIGKSVNHLRTHKNLEIQRKARSLVDTWKKRVAAEMNINDTRSGSNQAMLWPARSCLPEVAHGNRQTGGSSEVVGPKSPIVQLSSAKTAPAKLALGETNSKPGSPGPKLAMLSSNLKDGQNMPAVISTTSDLPSTASRGDEKSSSSSPSPNNSQSCSSDHAKTGGVFGKEDLRSSTAGSNKLSNGPCRSKKSIDGSGLSRAGSLQRNITPEKLVDVPAEGNSHKLIVKLPNRGQSPAQTVAGEALDDTAIVNSRASSPALSERPDQPDGGEEKGDSCRANDSANVAAESWQSNDFRDILTACDDAVGSVALPDEEQQLVADENTKKIALSEDRMKSSGDDVGMNLLASVAAGEIFRSELVSPTNSPKRDLVASVKQDCTGKGSEMKSLSQDCHVHESNGGCAAPFSDKGDCKTSTLCSEDLSLENRQLNSCGVPMEKTAEPIKSGNELTVAASVAVGNGKNIDGNPDAKMKVESSEIKVTNATSSLKSEEGCSVVVPASDKQKEHRDPDNGGLMELKSTEKVFAETIEKDRKNIGGVKVEKVGESDIVTLDTQNELKSDPLMTLDSAAVSEKVSECKLPVAGSKAEDTEECSSSNTVPAAVQASGTPVKLEFDLNEGLEAEDSRFGEPDNYDAEAIPLVSPLPLTGSSSAAGSLPAPIAVAVAAKGPFVVVPPSDLMRAKGERGGWKGSAATSAFRPAEPRKVLETPVGTLKPANYLDASSVRQSRATLDFDLNVAVERTVEEAAAPRHPVLQMASSYNNSRGNSHREMIGSTPPSGSGGLDLDLNRSDEAEDFGSSAVGNTRKLDSSLLPMRSYRHNDVEIGSHRGFDLNDGPVLDMLCAEPSTSGQHFRNSVLPQHTFPGHRMNSNDLGSFSTWFQTGSAVTIPSERGEQPFPMVAAGGPPRMFCPSGGIALNPGMYRGSVLSSSPTMPFPSSPFQYSVFPYGTSFPLPSASLSGTGATYVDPTSGGRIYFPPVHSQLSGPAGAVTSPYPRPYVVNLSDGGDSSKKWGSRAGLDLNMGPGGLDVEGRDESSPLVPRQLSVSGSPVLTEEQARMYHGVLKRKEPDGGWDRDSYRQQSWHQ